MPAPFLCQRKPATTQSAVRECLTLIIVRSPARYGSFEPLGHDAVEPGALEAAKPVIGQRAIAGGRREVHRRRRVGQHTLEPFAPLGERCLAQVFVAQRQEVPGDVRGGRLCGQELHPGGGGMDAQEQRFEVEAVGADDDDLAIDDASGPAAPARAAPGARGSSGSSASRRGSAAGCRRRRGTPGFETRPIWARIASRRRWAGPRRRWTAWARSAIANGRLTALSYRWARPRARPSPGATTSGGQPDSAR